MSELGVARVVDAWQRLVASPTPAVVAFVDELLLFVGEGATVFAKRVGRAEVEWVVGDEHALVQDDLGGWRLRVVCARLSTVFSHGNVEPTALYSGELEGEVHVRGQPVSAHFEFSNVLADVHLSIHPIAVADGT